MFTRTDYIRLTALLLTAVVLFVSSYFLPQYGLFLKCMWNLAFLAAIIQLVFVAMRSDDETKDIK
jgi:hypothetical protein